MAESDKADQKMAVNSQSLRSLLIENFYRLIRGVLKDISEPVQLIVSRSIIFSVFLAADQLLFLFFVWLSNDIKTRIIFVRWVLDGVQVVSIVAVSVYFISSTIAGLQSLWRTESERKSR